MAVDVAVAASCCPLGLDSVSTDSIMPDGTDCPQSEDSAGQMQHDTCCLACVVMLAAFQFPVMDAVAQSFSSPLSYINPLNSVSPPYRPPI